MEPRPLPPALGSAFSVKAAMDAGVSPRRLRARDLERPFHGVRARAAPVAEDAADRQAQQAHAYAVALPDGQFFCHVTAAVLWGLPLPRSALRAPGLDVGVLAPRRTPRGAGVRGHRLVHASTQIRVHPRRGVPLLAPACTWASLSAVLDVRDLVAVGDAIVRVPMFRGDPPALATLDDLAAASLGRRVGVARLRDALPLVRQRSASRTETWCRLALIEGGLPEPELNWNIVVNGRLLACVDLAYPRERVAVEYDGEHHRVDARQWSRDIERHEALAAAGWAVVRVTKQHLFADAGGVVARVRHALARQ